MTTVAHRPIGRSKSVGLEYCSLFRIQAYISYHLRCSKAACQSNQRTVGIYMKKLPLAQQKKIREMLYDRASNLLQYAHPPIGKCGHEI